MENPPRTVATPLLQGQDLLKQVKAIRKPLPNGFFKIIAAEVLNVILAGAVGWFYYEFLADRAGFYSVLTIGAVWFAVSALSAVAEDSRPRRFLIAVLETAAFVAPFFRESYTTVLSSAGILLAFIVWGDIMASMEYRNTITFRFSMFGRQKFGKMLSGVIIAGILLYIPALNSGKPLISESKFNGVYLSAAALSQVAYPSINFSGTVGEFTRNLAKQQLMRDPDFARLPPDMEDKEIALASDEIRASAEKTMGINLSASETIGKAFYDYTIKLLSGWRENFGSAFAFIWGLLLFMLIRGIGVIFVWLALALSWLVFEGLIAARVLCVVGETRAKEIVRFM